MSDFQTPPPKPQPERLPEMRTNRDPAHEQPKPTPELGRKPRFKFKDFASI
ncbi:hypothetical protein [Aliiruegeria lutimaris]|uniref:Uncharacterized protein n=1 Tax=Aliiruegeria lutimaris TaxID=571298 RepID=A0A1G8TL62_9RHOB|nr:hypothetical protein [Aliiruegeria lutimaris]SDJ42271.1 hypothetical protein SAMN04488026_101737 [Aliiruegeria lutimaris]